jgi:hypothetical protein
MEENKRPGVSGAQQRILSQLTIKGLNAMIGSSPLRLAFNDLGFDSTLAARLPRTSTRHYAYLDPE